MTESGALHSEVGLCGVTSSCNASSVIPEDRSFRSRREGRREQPGRALVKWEKSSLSPFFMLDDGSLKYRALLEISEALVAHQECGALFASLWESLRKLIRFDLLVLILQTEEGSSVAYRMAIAGEDEIDAEDTKIPLTGTPSGLVIETQKPLYVADFDSETRFIPQMMELFRRYQIQSGFWVPLTTTHRRLGALSFASRQLDPYGAEDREFMEVVARQVAISVENALAF